MKQLLSLIALSVAAFASDDTPLPVVIWHGLGDDATSEGMSIVGDILDSVHPGTFVYPINLAGGGSDRQQTFLGNVSQQIEIACDLLANHPILSTAPAIDALGFSQGGQFLRGYVERCNNPPVRSLVTYGSQHNGISEFRDCAWSDWVCRGAMALLKYNVWGDYVQSRVVPAQYYRNLDEYDSYLEHSGFLADINNERQVKNATYKKNLASLSKFVMVEFEDDTVVIPKQTSWFAEVNGTDVVPLKERQIYKEDWIGLKELDKKGALFYRSVTGEHMQFSDDALKDTAKEFFGPLKKGFVSEEL